MSYKINYSAEEKIKLAKDDSVEKLYESKKNQRTVRVLTVCAYVLTVSMAAIILSFYYVFLWKPSDASAKNAQHPNIKCDKIIIPENLAIRLANNTEVSALSFYADIIEQLMKMHIEAQHSQPHDQPRMNRSEFNNFLSFKSDQMQSDEAVVNKLRKKSNKKKKYQDDEDLNIDMESSGDKVVTTMFPIPTPDPLFDLNDTTIIFDQEQDD